MNRLDGKERVQAGVRLEKRLVKVLKALAELYDLSLGELMEDLVRDAFAGRLRRSGAGGSTRCPSPATGARRTGIAACWTSGRSCPPGRGGAGRCRTS